MPLAPHVIDTKKIPHMPFSGIQGMSYIFQWHSGNTWYTLNGIHGTKNSSPMLEDTNTQLVANDVPLEVLSCHWIYCQ